jgi:hypothetical protein
MRTREFDLLGRLAVTIPMRRVRCSASLSTFTSLCETIIADASRLNMVTDPSESIHNR